MILVSDLLHLIWSYPGPSMLLQMALFHSFHGWTIIYKIFGHDLATEQQPPHLLTLSVFTPCLLCLFSHAWVLYYDLFLKSLDYFFEKTERRKRSELHPSWDCACVGIPLPFALPPELLTATCHITSFASDQKSEQKRVVNVIVLFLLHGSL